ncbi:class Ib ribonucleoside-diphosphate reductase assembly flavoprotein NrdI [Ketogulonicigenium vulgare]|uniref:Protein NrdI n=1 Tax=Ketogulonicigenium vulgare (strain WSH-001) TaxID=759362 RepID=F9Y6I5_KETVW|nr:class Ib ribonucleoside-diphosphate reductase assembly flavoprotein NrdI [Ketogulonicigenium vulgare]ADO42744.1 nrdI protein [Ketogulonicigenium vulgare Y25]AEM40931.1 Ribonucleoside-diphosphate reductase 2, operon protein nrdI [Ketogulonicigenium vulgare WSH-001]ALJ81085.1 ribonucleotide reductase [Ketogulonicigenium vulgare]ANW33838.1 ribonucleotide reductase assembly protein NrdI [Ketogulonicigenium vulgare]AOZ54656.1 nrdI protein [Ketogulonicigenium vulgare]
MIPIYFYSSGTGNTLKLAEKLDRPVIRIPIRQDDPLPVPDGPFVLMVPTYGDGNGRGIVPKRVIHFLNDPENRKYLRGVVGTGNRNFGTLFCQAARIVAQKCGVPVLHMAELAGTAADVRAINDILARL